MLKIMDESSNNRILRPCIQYPYVLKICGDYLAGLSGQNMVEEVGNWSLGMMR